MLEGRERLGHPRWSFMRRKHGFESPAELNRQYFEGPLALLGRL